MRMTLAVSRHMLKLIKNPVVLRCGSCFPYTRQLILEYIHLHPLEDGEPIEINESPAEERGVGERRQQVVQRVWRLIREPMDNLSSFGLKRRPDRQGFASSNSPTGSVRPTPSPKPPNPTTDSETEHYGPAATKSAEADWSRRGAAWVRGHWASGDPSPLQWTSWRPPPPLAPTSVGGPGHAKPCCPLQIWASSLPAQCRMLYFPHLHRTGAGRSQGIGALAGHQRVGRCRRPEHSPRCSNATARRLN
jgi:hypothetical protein